MSGLINLKDKSYENVNRENHNTESAALNIDNIVDDIVMYLVRNKSSHINDVEKGLIPKSSLNNEIINYITENRISLDGENSRDELIKKVSNYLFGYGICQELIDDPNISDIKIKGLMPIRIKEKGVRKSTELKFTSIKSLWTYCYYVSIKNKGNLSELTAIQKLSDSESNKHFRLRINIKIPPAADVPQITIRKIPKVKVPLKDLVHVYKMLSEEMAEYYIDAIENEYNILFCGRGGSGKTTLMNAGLEHIPEDEAILIMQESEELFTDHPECLIGNAIYKSGENDIEYTLQTHATNGLLQDVDRMIIGEVKGPEAWDLFNAVYTGHVGWTSLHSNGAEKALPKALHYVKTAKIDLSEEAIMEMLSEFDLVVFMKKFKVLEMTEIKGFNPETKTIEYNPVFAFDLEEGKFKRLNDSCDKVKAKHKLKSW